MILKILKYPSFVLRKKAKKINEVGDKEKKLISDMLETLKESQGLGLAAPQIGESKRIIVMENSMALINPVIVEKSKELELMEEGCLCFPDMAIEIKRPKQIRVEFLDENGKAQELDFKGFEARIVQHEIDHLDGKLIIDYLKPKKRILSLLKYFSKS